MLENKVFADLLKSTERHLEKRLPFVLYRKPGEGTVMGLFQNNDSLHTSDDYAASGFIFAPYDGRRPAVLLNPDQIIGSQFEVADNESQPGYALDNTATASASYMEMIREAIREIDRETLRKVVLSRQLEIKTKVNPLKVFQQILSLYPKALCYLWYHPKVGLWAGASPEVFLTATDRIITTMALAGTQKIQNELPPNWGKKEKQEQQLVTDYILSALKGKVTGIRASAVESVQAGSLWHLKTTISGDLDGSSLKDIIKALHPTPAICGMPLAMAKAFIASHEPHNREYYTGFLGELNMGIGKQSKLFVNLRCMKISPEYTRIFVGGGITKDSVPEMEWQETIDKSEIMARAIFNSRERLVG